MSLAREITQFIQLYVSKSNTESIFDGSFNLKTPEAVQLINRIDSFIQQNKSKEEMLILILQVILINKSFESVGIENVQFIATLPGTRLAGVKSTYLTISTLLREAQNEIVAFGYEINDKDIITMFHKCSQKNINIFLACDRERESGKSLFENWPQKGRSPNIYEDFRYHNSAIYSKMHSKLILIDRQKLLLTSANFTYHGMQGNIEFGVLLEGPVVSNIREVLIALLSTKLFVKISKS